MASVAADFLRLFAAGVGEVAIRVGLAVTLQDSRKGAVLGAVVIAAAIVYTVNVHPGDGQVLHVVAFGEPDVVIGHGISGSGTHAALHVLHQRVAEHGTETESRNEHATRIDTVVFIQGGERLCEEVVVALALGPYATDCIERNEDVVAVLVEHLLAVVRGRMVIVRIVVHKVFAAATVAVQGEQYLVRFLVVVVLGQGDKVVAGIAANLDLELVAVFDALDFLQLGRRSATLTRGGLVAERVAELEFFLGLFQFHVKRGIERAERNGERFKSVGHKTDGLALGSLLHKHGFVSLHAECATVAAVSRKLEILPSAPDRDLGKVGAASLDGATQVIRAGTLQGLSENLVAERVENLHLDG